LLMAGTLDVGTLTTAAEENGLEGLRVREMMDSGMIEAGAVTASVPRGWLAGVRGALRN
jgi:type IV pilus assembly protein PilM